MRLVPYVSFEVEFEKPQDLNDLYKPIEVLQNVLQAIPSKNLLGYNFNRYYSPNIGLYHPNMDLRLNLRDLEQSRDSIKKALQNLVDKGVIRHFGREPRPWDEPQFVKEAHEASTKCAIIFVDRLRIEPSLMESLRSEPLKFMTNFVHLLLKSMGLPSLVAWTYLRTTPPDEVRNLAQACGATVSDCFKSQTGKADFLERFLHTFFNCTLMEAEREVLPIFSDSMFWKQLASGG